MAIFVTTVSGSSTPSGAGVMMPLPSGRRLAEVRHQRRLPNHLPVLVRQEPILCKAVVERKGAAASN